ncbi:MAG: hypothetical protein H7Z19_17325 [Chitinophagaceae bacterium]|nr:hypothetical protein [Rubrivivax sp.]
MDELSAWMGCSESQHDIVTAGPDTALRATLDHPEQGGGAPGTVLTMDAVATLKG